MCMPHYLLPNETDRFDANFYRPERKVERQLFFWHNFFCKTLSVQTIKKEPAYPDLLRTGPCALKSQISSFRIISTPLPSGLCCVTGEFTTVAPRGSGNAPSWHAGALPFVRRRKGKRTDRTEFQPVKTFHRKKAAPGLGEGEIERLSIGFGGCFPAQRSHQGEILRYPLVITCATVIFDLFMVPKSATVHQSRRLFAETLLHNPPQFLLSQWFMRHDEVVGGSCWRMYFDVRR